MRVAIVHYHLKPGGVTRVIENTVNAMMWHDVEMVILSSEPYTGKLPLNVSVVPGLAYTRENEKPDPGALAFAMSQAARQALGKEPDIWHFHNHALGKNNGLPQALVRLLKHLAAEKTGMLLQIHDFAEDGRPSNYETLRKQVLPVGPLYPMAPQIHYAVLNGRDREFLLQSGLPSSQLHWLPNPVALPDISEPSSTPPDWVREKPLWLYPTRGIRRKNMGEFVLLAALHGKACTLASTLAPDNPDARPVYDRWVRFAEEKRIPLRWAIGSDPSVSFADWMTWSAQILTTSVAEGFGLAYLEPWLFGKPLAGRDLPDITADFKEAGLQLPGLYRRIPIPLAWVGKDALLVGLRKALRAYYEAYGCKLAEDAAQLAYDAIVEKNTVDFGFLDERLQEQVISRVLESGEQQKELSRILRPTDVPLETINANAESIRQAFGLESYGKRLKSIYQTILDSPHERVDFLPSEKVLTRFLNPARFNLLRT